MERLRHRTPNSRIQIDRPGWRSAITGRGLFTAALDHLGIPWRRATEHIVSIYRKAATARLNEFIGPKDVAVPLENVHYTA